MKIKELLKSTKGKVIAGALAVLILGGGVTAFAITRDKGETAKESYDKKAEQMEEEAEENIDSAEKSSEASSEDKSENKGNDTKSDSKSKTEASTSSKSSSSSSSSVASSKSTSASKSSSSSSSSSSPAPKKEKKWVVDKPAWTETVKVPVTKYRKYWWIKYSDGSNRNFYDYQQWKLSWKGADGLGVSGVSSYGGPKQEEYTDYETKTINHPEKGHWE